MKKENSTQLYGVKEIARRADVSLATVDRVIHKRPGVSARTRDKINKIIKELDYQPNLLARQLASGKTWRLATLIPKVSTETAYWEAPLNGILQAETEIRQFGIQVEKYFFDQNDKTSFVKQTELILKSGVDGILLAPSFIEESIRFTGICQKQKIPYVFINSDIPDRDSLCYIGPHLYRSGYLAAHLVSYLVTAKSKILVLNISREIGFNHHILRKEEGFRTYFRDNGKSNEIMTIEIRNADHSSVKKSLAPMLEKHPDIGVIFVTNSKVAVVAHYLESIGKGNVLLIGYDFIEDNIACLKNGSVDFLICQKPQEQGYRGVMTLYQHLAMGATPEKVYHMPIDILTRENYAFYRN